MLRRHVALSRPSLELDHCRRVFVGMIFFYPPIRLVTVTNKGIHNQALKGAAHVVQDGIGQNIRKRLDFTYSILALAC